MLPRVRGALETARTYGAVAALALDHRMSPDYVPGQLYLLGRISQTELDAGAKIARIYGRFERLHNLRRDSLSPDYQIGRGRSLSDGPRDAVEIGADFRLLSERLAVTGSGVRAALEQFWVEGRHIDARSLSAVLKATAGAMRSFERAKKRRRRG